ncbi:MAG: serine/threonine protein kinase [Actinobacteria bacterium]|nr:serine/threonine protein kinase [Actinomycetota bacterium]
MARPHTQRAPDAMIADRYSLVARIGSGASGTVWEGRDHRLDRRVAIKQVELPDEVSDPDRSEVRQRVLREARTAAQLNHRAATTVHDVVEENGTAFLVMELVDAPDLTRIVSDDGPMSDQDAARIALPILDALEAAHRRGIIHRDVKPSNVLVPSAGPPKLTDFGIASVTDDPRLTSTGVVLGSPAYMSPEQIQGDEAGPAADLWGLGATLYFAIEGRPPFERGTSVATLHAVVNDDPRPFDRTGPLVDVIHALLRKDPDERPDPGELRAMLQNVTAGAAPAETERLEDPTTAGAAATTPIDPPARDRPDAEPRRERSAVDGTPDSSGRGRLSAAARLLALLGALGLVAFVAVLGIQALGGGAGGETQTAEQQDEAQGQAEDRAQDQGQERDEGQGRADGEGDGQQGGEDAQVPGSWQRYDADGEPYTFAHPADWQVQQRSGNRTDFQDPGSGAYVRIGWTDDPNGDPVQDREEYSQRFAESHEDYQELTLEGTSFRGHDAALWEYTYREGGTQLHAIQISWVADGRGYAINYQTHEGDWQDMRGLWPQIQAAFEMSG